MAIVFTLSSDDSVSADALASLTTSAASPSFFSSALTVASRWSTLSTVTMAEVTSPSCDDSFCSAGSGMITPASVNVLPVS